MDVSLYPLGRMASTSSLIINAASRQVLDVLGIWLQPSGLFEDRPVRRRLQLHVLVPVRALGREVGIRDGAIPRRPVANVIFRLHAHAWVTTTTTKHRGHDVRIHLDTLVQPRTRELHTQQSSLVFGVVERDQEPLTADIAKVNVDGVVRDLVRYEPLEPLLDVLEHRVLELLERLPDYGEASVPQAVRRRRLLHRSPQKLEDARRRFAGAHGAGDQPVERA